MTKIAAMGWRIWMSWQWHVEIAAESLVCQIWRKCIFYGGGGCGEID